MDRLLKFNGRWADDMSREVYLEVLVSSITGISSLHLSDRSYDRYIHFGKSKVLVPETPWLRVVAAWHDYQRWRESQASTPTAPEPRLTLATDCPGCRLHQDNTRRVNARNTSLVLNLDEAHRRINSLVGERDALQASNSGAFKRIDELRERNDRQGHIIRDQDKNVIRLERLNADLQRENADLQRSLAAATQTIEANLPPQPPAEPVELDWTKLDLAGMSDDDVVALALDLIRRLSIRLRAT